MDGGERRSGSSWEGKSMRNQNIGCVVKFFGINTREIILCRRVPTQLASSLEVLLVP